MTSSESSQKNVLVVEDDSFISTSFVHKLTKEGFTPFAAASAFAAHKLLESETIHFILLDIMLPDEDGLGFLEKMKKDEKYKDIPVMVLSNIGSEDAKERAMKLGAKEYLVKAESSPGEIVEKIKQHLA